MGATLMLSFLGILAIGVPVAFALGIAAIIMFAIINPSLLALLPQRIFTGIDLFALVAVPFFILAGELMGGSGILDRIMAFSRMKSAPTESDAISWLPSRCPLIRSTA